MLQRFPLIVGPTAGGKSALALALVRHLREATGANAEIVSADSMQVYRGMDIGTAKPTPEERRAAVHHLIDIVSPSEPFSVDRWLERAEPLIDELRARDTLPIVVGGTHLYAKALLEGLFDSPEPNPDLRARLTAMDPHERRARLERVDPDAAARIHPNDVRRTVRALEVWESTGQPISAHQSQWDAGRVRPDVLLVGLEWPTEQINRRINTRVKQMMERGFLDEVRALDEAGLSDQAAQALGYTQLLEIIRAPEGGAAGTEGLERAVERIKIETRRFAKNQRTWLRRLRSTPGSLWIDATSGAPEEWAQFVAEQLVTIK